MLVGARRRGWGGVESVRDSQEEKLGQSGA